MAHKRKNKPVSGEKEAEEKKEDNQRPSGGLGKDKSLIYIILALAVIFGLIFLWVSTINNKSPDTPIDNIEVRNYNGFSFERQGNIWLTRLNIKDKLTGKSRD